MSRFIELRTSSAVEIDMSDIDMDDMVEEIQRRLSLISRREKIAFLSCLEEILDNSGFRSESLLESQMNELFEEAKSKYSLWELQERLR